MPKPPAATLTLLLLTACTGSPDADAPEIMADLARQRIKLEDLAYCTAEEQERNGQPADDPAFAAAVDRCMAGLGYTRLGLPAP